MTAELHVLVGAYALDALEDREQVAFEAHLDGCLPCAAELDGFRATVERLGSAVALPPAPELRAKLLESVSRTPQERPGVATLAAPTSWRQRAPVLVAAASLLATVGAVGAYIVEHDRASDLQIADKQKAAVLAAADATPTTSRVDGATLRVWSSESMDRAVVVMSGAPALQPTQSYQLWTVEAGEAPHSFAVMGPDDLSASTSVLVPELEDATTIAVTVEPEGGSERPTSEPVLSVDVP
jgi:anti-sigma-K factor RskA